MAQNRPEKVIKESANFVRPTRKISFTNLPYSQPPILTSSSRECSSPVQHMDLHLIRPPIPDHRAVNDPNSNGVTPRADITSYDDNSSDDSLASVSNDNEGLFASGLPSEESGHCKGVSSQHRLRATNLRLQMQKKDRIADDNPIEEVAVPTLWRQSPPAHRQPLPRAPTSSKGADIRDVQLATPRSEPHLCGSRLRIEMYSEPESNDITALPDFRDYDAPRLHSLPTSLPLAPPQRMQIRKPTASLSRLSSLDSLLKYREDKAAWRRSSSMLQQPPLLPSEGDPTRRDSVISDGLKNVAEPENLRITSILKNTKTSAIERTKFRNFASEIGFCFTIAMAQFLTEYLISGFAIELSKLTKGPIHDPSKSQSMGVFWPAALLPLILSATLLIFARLSDMYGGYPSFMFGVTWLSIWTLIPGFCHSRVMLDVSRSMQGLAIAAFMPSTFAMVGSTYVEGPRKNFVMGLYSGCAPLGFFGGLLVAASLSQENSPWYFWIAFILSGFTLITAFLTVPSDRTNRTALDLEMDWIGACLITSGLILVLYALSVEPYANRLQPERSGFSFSGVIVPLVSGFVLLFATFWYEGWCSRSPLLPFEFFKPKGVKPLSLAGLCFYATYGAWLYNSAQFFQSPTVTLAEHGISGTKLALWYLPTAVGGLILCIAGGSLIHVVPIMVLLLISAFAWIAAPLLLALAPLPLSYWEYVMPSMVCATLGIDITFTVSIVFISSAQPQGYQGLAGAVCSILVNLAMSFALSISEIVMEQAEHGRRILRTSVAADATALGERINRNFRATFVYGAVSAGVGLIICVLFVRVSRYVVSKRIADEERPPTGSSESTLVGEGDIQDGTEDVQENSAVTDQNPETRRRK